MLAKRLGQDHDEALDQSSTTIAAETLRASASRRHAAEAKDEDKMSLFWRVFGGTILSIVALVAITLYNNLNTGISDLRNELSREREARAGLAKKDEVDSRSKAQYDRIRVVEGYKADIEAIKERVTANAAAVDATRKELGTSIDVIKKDNAGLDLLKERVTAVEAVKKDLAAVDVLKERIANLTTDLKGARDDLQKLQQELEKNKIADLERKSARDLQARQLDETLKDLQKGLQDCREKLARLEGPQTAPAAPKAERVVPVKGEQEGPKGR